MPTRSKPQTAGPAVKTAAGRRRANKAGTVSADERRRLIAEAAYFKAEARGFAAGGEVDDWIAAEAEIDALLAARQG